MKIKTFKNKLEKISNNINSELEKLRNFADELIDDELAEMVNELADNISIMIVEETDERPTKVNLQTIHEYIEESENLLNDFTEDE